jgi:subtilisin-like proprotein convertase family protein
MNILNIYRLYFSFQKIVSMSFIILLLLICNNTSHCLEFLINQEYTESAAIPEHDLGKIFPIIIDQTGIIAEVTVSVSIDHTRPSDLDIYLKHPGGETVILFSGRQGRIPPGSSGIYRTFDDPDKPVTSLRNFAGKESFGEWELLVKDLVSGEIGILQSWSIEIELVQGAVLFASQYGRSLRIMVDGYGSFGDQTRGNWFGAQYQPSPSFFGKTVFSSALLVDYRESAENQYLTSVDNLPGERLPSVPLIDLQDGSYASWFNVGPIEAALVQSLMIVDEFIWLVQDYEFWNIAINPEPVIISRYLNSQFRLQPAIDTIGKENFFFPKEWQDDKPTELFVFDEIKSATTKDPFISIDFRSDSATYHGFWVDEWYPNVGNKFDDVLFEKGRLVYSATSSADQWHDFDGDGFTDFNDRSNAFDVGFSQGAKLDFSETKRKIRYVALTRWGYAAPDDIASSTDYFEYEFTDRIPTPTPTMTPTEIPTSTPTPTLTPSPTPVNVPPRWIKPLPDIRLLANQEANNILNLADYVHDPDTSINDLVLTNWSKPTVLPLSINSDHILACSAVADVGDYGLVTIYMHDGVNDYVPSSFRVKVVSALTRSFRPVPPIVFASGETVYQSPYVLDDLIHDPGSLEDGYFEWSVNEMLPDGISVQIAEDSSFTVTKADDWDEEILSLPLMLRWYSSSATPIPTNTPTLVPTNTPTIVPTNTPTSTATSTPTNTPTFTPTFTHTFTPTPSDTPSPVITFTPTFTPEQGTPTPTLPPASTPTPSGPTATPIPNCSDAFDFSGAISKPLMMGPIDWMVIPRGDSDQVVVAHYDQGVIGFYDNINNQWSLRSQIDSSLGAANIAWGDFNGDSIEDIYELNSAQEELIIHQADAEGNSSVAHTLVLKEERITDIYNIENGVRYQSLAVGKINDDNLIDAVIRSQRSILVAVVDQTQLSIKQRIEINGITRFIKGDDLDADGDIDILVGARSTAGEEQVMVYLNQEGQLVLSQTLRTDQSMSGNNPMDLKLVDWDKDGNNDLMVLDFSGSVQRFIGDGSGRFAVQPLESSIFPPGDVVGFDIADYDLDGNLDVIVLHRSQDGLALLAACGQDVFSIATFPISDAALNGEIYVLKSVDVDKDGDMDVMFTRNFHDDLVLMENRVKSSSGSN